MPKFNDLSQAFVGSDQVLRLYRGNAPIWAAVNKATGGNVTDVPNYNGTGETWRVHEFTGNGTFSVEVAIDPFRVGMIGGGNGAVGNVLNQDPQGPEGRSAVWQEWASVALTSQDYSVVVGSGGGGSSPAHGAPGSASSPSSAFGLTGPSNGGPGGGRNGTPKSSNITGTSKTYGPLCAGRSNGATPGSQPGQGGGGCSVELCGGASGYRGVVIVAYKIDG